MVNYRQPFSFAVFSSSLVCSSSKQECSIARVTPCNTNTLNQIVWLVSSSKSCAATLLRDPHATPTQVLVSPTPSRANSQLFLKTDKNRVKGGDCRLCFTLQQTTISIQGCVLIDFCPIYNGSRYIHLRSIQFQQTVRCLCGMVCEQLSRCSTAQLRVRYNRKCRPTGAVISTQVVESGFDDVNNFVFHF